MRHQAQLGNTYDKHAFLKHVCYEGEIERTNLSAEDLHFDLLWPLENPILSCAEEQLIALNLYHLQNFIFVSGDYVRPSA